MLGPSTATFTAGAVSGTLIAAITGLLTGETIDTVAPNDGRLAVDGTRRNLIVGLSAAIAGTIAATLTTSAGRTLNIAFTVGGGVYPQARELKTAGSSMVAQGSAGGMNDNEGWPGRFNAYGGYIARYEGHPGEIGTSIRGYILADPSFKDLPSS